MIKDNQKLLNRLHVVLDALIIIFSYGVAWLIRFKSGFFELSSWYLSLEQYMKLLIYCSVIFNLILCVSFVHIEAGARKTTGSMAHCSGQHGRTYGLDFIPVFRKDDGLFP